MSGLRVGQIGKLFAALEERRIAEVAIVGALTRPEFADLRFDWGALKRAPRAGASRFAAATIACSPASLRSSSAKACGSSARTRSRRNCSRRRPDRRAAPRRREAEEDVARRRRR